MTEDQGLNPEEQTQHQVVSFDYIKSNLFRIVHVDGAVGNITPQGRLHLAFWSERNPIPRQVVHEIMPDGTLSDEIQQVSRGSIVREVEVGLMIDPETARALIDLLKDSLENLDRLRKKGGTNSQ